MTPTPRPLRSHEQGGFANSEEPPGIMSQHMDWERPDEEAVAEPGAPTDDSEDGDNVTPLSKVADSIRTEIANLRREQRQFARNAQTSIISLRGAVSELAEALKGPGLVTREAL